MKYKYPVFYIFSAFVVGSYYFGYTPPLVSLVLLLFSALAYLYYAKDKRAALNGSWRVSENTLHFLSLCGGWPGALLAQEKLRHKTRKLSFRAVFWCTVLANIVGLAWLHTPQGRLQLRNGVFQFESLAKTYVKSDAVISAVFFLTSYRAQRSPHDR